MFGLFGRIRVKRAKWPAMTDRLLRAEDVAKRLQLRVDHIYKLAREGQIPHLRFGRSLRFRAEAIETWLREQERGNGRGFR